MPTLITRTCEGCGVEFTKTEGFINAQMKHGNPVKCCSMACVYLAKKRRARTPRPCAHCGKEIWTYNSQAGNVKSERKYCSKSCMDSHRSTIAKCQKCGAEFKHFRAIRRTFCGHACAGVTKSTLTRECKCCGKSFVYLPKDELTAKYCSFPCKQKHFGLMRRKPANDKYRLQRAVWRETRAFVIARDGGVCQSCGTSHDLTVHHIVKWRISKDDSPQNLITYCRTCHLRIEFGGIIPDPGKRYAYGC